MDEGKSFPPLLTTLLRPLISFSIGLSFFLGTFLAFFFPTWLFLPLFHSIFMSLRLIPSGISTLNFFLLLLLSFGLCGVPLFHFGSFFCHIFDLQITYRSITPSLTPDFDFAFDLAARLFLPREVSAWKPPSPVWRCAGCCLIQPRVMCCLIQLLVFLNDRYLFVKPSVEL